VIFLETPIFFAIKGNHAKIVEYLIANGSDIHKFNWTHSTPLHIAAENGNLDIIQLLVKNGAEIDSKNDSV